MTSIHHEEYPRKGIYRKRTVKSTADHHFRAEMASTARYPRHPVTKVPLTENLVVGAGGIRGGCCKMKAE